jgi:hypothetical protein
MGRICIDGVVLLISSYNSLNFQEIETTPQQKNRSMNGVFLIDIAEAY